jgi:DNA-directed RNA polymerase specialized sigma subunit
MTQSVLIALVTLLSATALWDFAKFLINRKDDTKAQIVEVKKSIHKLGERIDENQAVLARTHILRFDDELLNDIKHSKEYFSQTLQDIDVYEAFCMDHPNFKNSYATAAINHIRSTYDDLLKKHNL